MLRSFSAGFNVLGLSRPDNQIKKNLKILNANYAFTFKPLHG